MDRILIILGALLITTVALFLLGVTPYPFGWILFSLLFAARWFRLKYRKDRFYGSDDISRRTRR